MGFRFTFHVGFNPVRFKAVYLAGLRVKNWVKTGPGLLFGFKVGIKGDLGEEVARLNFKFL